MNDVILSPLDERDHIYGNLNFGARAPRPSKYRAPDLPRKHQAWSLMCVNFALARGTELDANDWYGKQCPPLAPMFGHMNTKKIDGAPSVGGTYWRSALAAAKNNGFCPETLYPFIDDANTRKNIFPKPSNEAIAEALKYRIGAYARISTLNEVLDAIYFENGVYISMAIYESFWKDYKGYLPKPTGSLSGYHALIMDGYDDNWTMVVDGIEQTNIIHITDSYGKTTGDEGEFYLPYEALDWFNTYSVDRLIMEMWTTYDPENIVATDYNEQHQIDVMHSAYPTVKLTPGNIIALVDDVEIAMSKAPFIANGTTLVPLRFIASAFGCNVQYYSATGNIIIWEKNLHRIIRLTKGSNIATIGDKEYVLLEAPRIIDGVTMIPVRFVFDVLKYYVDFEPITKLITIKGMN